MKLETERLVLRDWKKTDMRDLIEGLNNFEVSRWLAFVPYPYEKKDAESWISHCIEISKKRSRNTYEFAIELKSERRVIGGTSLGDVDKIQGTAGGGIWINRKYHGNGYGREAFGARLEFAFEKLKLRRIESGYFPGNDASSKMQKSLGFKVEGLKRRRFISKSDGKSRDEYMMGLSREDWEKF